MSKNRKISCKKPGSKQIFLLDCMLVPGQQGRDGWMYLGQTLYRPTMRAAIGQWQGMAKVNPRTPTASRFDHFVENTEPAELEIDALQFQVLVEGHAKALSIALKRAEERDRLKAKDKERKRDSISRSGRENFIAHADNGDFRWCRMHEAYEFLPLTAAITAKLQAYETAVGVAKFGHVASICMSELRDKARLGKALPLELVPTSAPTATQPAAPVAQAAPPVTAPMPDPMPTPAVATPARRRTRRT